MPGSAWETMERNALWALEHAPEVAPKGQVEGMGPILRLWTYSTSGTHTSWTILAAVGSEEPGRPLVREILWKRRQDEQRMASMNRKHKLRTKLQATVQVRDAEISPLDLHPFLDAAARLFVPEKSREGPPRRGDTSGFEGYRSLAYLRMEWQEPGPVEWTDTTTWVARLRQLLLASLQERERA